MTHDLLATPPIACNFKEPDPIPSYVSLDFSFLRHRQPAPPPPPQQPAWPHDLLSAVSPKRAQGAGAGIRNGAAPFTPQPKSVWQSIAALTADASPLNLTVDDHTPRMCDDADLFWKCTREEPGERHDRERAMEEALERELQQEWAQQAAGGAAPTLLDTSRLSLPPEPEPVPPVPTPSPPPPALYAAPLEIGGRPWQHLQPPPDPDGKCRPGEVPSSSAPPAPQRASGSPQRHFESYDDIMAGLGKEERWEDIEFPRLPDPAIRWRRTADLWSRCRFRTSFPGQPDYGSDMCRGTEGDSWLLGAMAVVASSPALMKQVIGRHDQRRSVFEFRFFQAGHWVPVCVDDFLPVGPSGSLLFGQSDEEGELWVPLLHKAYAKLCGGYGGLRRPSAAALPALAALSGGVPQVLAFPDPWPDAAYQQDARLVLTRIRHALAERWPVAATWRASSQPVNGLLPDHLYPIAGLHECQLTDGSFVYLLRVMNPWGLKGLWHGPWSYSSALWDTHPEVERSLGRPVRGFHAALDGSFWMDVDSFFLHAEEVVLLHTYHCNAGLQPFFHTSVSTGPQVQCYLRASSAVAAHIVLSSAGRQPEGQAVAVWLLVFDVTGVPPAALAGDFAQLRTRQVPVVAGHAEPLPLPQHSVHCQLQPLRDYLVWGLCQASGRGATLEVYSTDALQLCEAGGGAPARPCRPLALKPATTPASEEDLQIQAACRPLVCDWSAVWREHQPVALRVAVARLPPASQPGEPHNRRRLHAQRQPAGLSPSANAGSPTLSAASASPRHADPPRAARPLALEDAALPVEAPTRGPSAVSRAVFGPGSAEPAPALTGRPPGKAEPASAAAAPLALPPSARPARPAEGHGGSTPSCFEGSHRRSASPAITTASPPAPPPQPLKAAPPAGPAPPLSTAASANAGAVARGAGMPDSKTAGTDGQGSVVSAGGPPNTITTTPKAVDYLSDDILPELPGDSAFSWLASLTPSERRLFATIMAKAQPPGQPPAALSATLPPAVITAAPDPDPKPSSTGPKAPRPPHPQSTPLASKHRNTIPLAPREREAGPRGRTTPPVAPTAAAAPHFMQPTRASVQRLRAASPARRPSPTRQPSPAQRQPSPAARRPSPRLAPAPGRAHTPTRQPSPGRPAPPMTLDDLDQHYAALARHSHFVPQAVLLRGGTAAAAAAPPPPTARTASPRIRILQAAADPTARGRSPTRTRPGRSHSPGVAVSRSVSRDRADGPSAGAQRPAAPRTQPTGVGVPSKLSFLPPRAHDVNNALYRTPR